MIDARGGGVADDGDASASRLGVGGFGYLPGTGTGATNGLHPLRVRVPVRVRGGFPQPLAPARSQPLDFALEITHAQTA